jgi:hypothetical protein
LPKINKCSRIVVISFGVGGYLGLRRDLRRLSGQSWWRGKSDRLAGSVRAGRLGAGGDARNPKDAVTTQ